MVSYKDNKSGCKFLLCLFYSPINKSSIIVTKLFFSVVSRKSVQNTRGISGASRGKENCIMCKNVNCVMFKIALQNKGNMPYYFL